MQEIQNPALLQRYEQYKAALPAGIINGNEQLVFHGCSAAVIDSIAEKGLLRSYQTSAAGSWQRFGRGFYFALQASKSHEYPIAEMSALLVGQHTRKMILCKLAKGKELQTSVNMDQLTGAPEGYQCVHGLAQADGPLNFDELVVYNEAALLPYAVVTFEFSKSQMVQPDYNASEEGAPASPRTDGEVFVVKATGEILTMAELFDKEIPKSQCWLLAEAAAEARATATEVLSKVQEDGAVYARGLAAIEGQLSELERNRGEIEDQIHEAVAKQLASITSVLRQRETELCVNLRSECDGRKAALDAQHTEVNDQQQSNQRICDAMALASQQNDLEVLRSMNALSGDIAAASTASVLEIKPAPNGTIPSSAEAALKQFQQSSALEGENKALAARAVGLEAELKGRHEAAADAAQVAAGDFSEPL